MGVWRQVVGVVVVCAAVALSGAPASAEWFADLFLGGAFTEDAEPSAKVPVGGVTTTITNKGVDHDDSLVFGGRLGYWIDALPYVGVGLDVSHFHADQPAQARPTFFNPDPAGLSGSRLPANKVDLDITVISFDLMLRWPLLTSPAFPRGRLQPYVSAGPGIFIVEVTDFGNVGPGTQSATDVSVGVKVAGGLTWLFTSRVGVFTEYRFLHYSPEHTFTRAADPVTRARVTATGSADQSTHQVVAGVTFRF